VAPRSAAFDTLPTHPPAWLKVRRPLTTQELHTIDREYRLRVQDVQSVDRLLASIETALRSAGASRNTVIVFSSDNGYHMGEYRLAPGKLTAFDTDITVPLVVSGPGIPPATTSPAVVQNVDLAPTFEALAGLPPNPGVDGRSLVALMHGARVAGWTTAALVEHRGPDTNLADPDHPPPHSGNPPSYEAIRTATYTYVEYATGGKEYYDRVTDPLELHNVVAQLSPHRQTMLHRTLRALETCHGAAQCTVARGAG
jgi:arylsulfatase A-like enzyme